MNQPIIEKITIMIDIILEITNYSRLDAYRIIVLSNTFEYLKQLDYSTSYDSPQANLASIGEELRNANNKLGSLITDDSIKKAMYQMRKHYDETKSTATEAAVKILNTLVFDWKIPVNYIFDFFSNSNKYKKLLDDDILIISLHDSSIDEIIQTIVEQIACKYDKKINSENWHTQVYKVVETLKIDDNTLVSIRSGGETIKSNWWKKDSHII